MKIWSIANELGHMRKACTNTQEGLSMIFHLGFQLQSQTKFVSSLVEVFQVNQWWQGNRNS